MENVDIGQSLGLFFSCINPVLASEGRSQSLFTVGLDLSVVFSCELGLLFLRSPESVWDV